MGTHAVWDEEIYPAPPDDVLPRLSAAQVRELLQRSLREAQTEQAPTEAADFMASLRQRLD